MNAQHGHALQHGHDFLGRGAQIERLGDVAANARRVHVGAGGIHRDRDQFVGLGIEHAPGDRMRAHRHEAFDPFRIDGGGLVPGGIPLPLRAHGVANRCLAHRSLLRSSLFGIGGTGCSIFLICAIIFSI
jgi:hypothetical protein